jgi:hypothetical protein
MNVQCSQWVTNWLLICNVDWFWSSEDSVVPRGQGPISKNLGAISIFQAPDGWQDAVIHGGLTVLELSVKIAVIYRSLLGASAPVHVFVCKEKSAIICWNYLGSLRKIQSPGRPGAWDFSTLAVSHCRSKLPPSPRFFPKWWGDFRTCNHICNDHISIVGCTYRSRDSLVRIVNRFRAENRGIMVRYPEGAKKSSKRPDRIWDSPSLLIDAYQVFVPGGETAGAWNWPVTPIQFRG